MRKLILLFHFILTISIYSFGQSNSVEVWIKAFIPDPQNAGGGRGYINDLPSGGSSVKVQNLNASLPNVCYSTDHRGFSYNPSSTSRLETKFTLTFNENGTGKVVPSQNRTTTSITKKVDCSTGGVLGQKLGRIDRDKIGTPSVANGVIQVSGQITGTNLLVPIIEDIPPAENWGPSIDYTFDLQWKPSTATLIAAVTIGSFPAFEMYARQPNGKWTNIIQQLPAGAPWQLGGDGFGINSVRVVETKIVTGISGKWQSPNPEQRFTLEFEGKKVKWTEKNQSGATLIKEVNINELSAGKFKIERPNNDEALAFLGFQQSLRTEILLSKPLPSYIILYYNNDKIIVEWNGLIATKDANAHLRELIQPGARPPKIYEMVESQ